MKHEGWAGKELPSAHRASLVLYEQLLLDLAVPRGIVSASDSAHLRTRHISDSLRGVPYILPEAERVVDLGSGAGFPGIPISVARPDLEVTLAEPRQARAAFLELVVERLQLPNVRVFAGPAQELAPGLDMCVARGFGDARRTWGVARDLIEPGGALMYWAGKSFELSDVPADAQVRVVDEATLESGGPIVIMTRQ